MSFNGLNARSTLNEVIAKFPSAKHDTICKGTVGTFGNGKSLCEFIKLEEYPLNGYMFEAAFFFRPNGTLKTISLHWPPIRENTVPPSEEKVRNVKLEFVELFASKYGPPLDNSLCQLADSNCTEWLVNGSDANFGGDRIQIKAQLQSSDWRSIDISYEFANVGEYSRF